MEASVNNKGSDERGESTGQEQRTVETVDYRSSVGVGQEQRPVEIIHQPHSVAAGDEASGCVLASAAASVKSTLQSVKEVSPQTKVALG